MKLTYIEDEGGKKKLQQVKEQIMVVYLNKITNHNKRENMKINNT